MLLPYILKLRQEPVTGIQTLGPACHLKCSLPSNAKATVIWYETGRETNVYIQVVYVFRSNIYNFNSLMMFQYLIKFILTL